MALTVRELIGLLKDLPPDLDVYLYSEDNSEYEPLMLPPRVGRHPAIIRYASDPAGVLDPGKGERVEISPGLRYLRDFE